MENKKCTKCNEVKDINLFPNYKNRKGVYKKLGYCKNCQSIISKKWNLKNKKKVAYQNNERCKKYRLKNNKKINKYQKRYRDKNKNKVKNYIKNQTTKEIENLKDNYIIKLIVGNNKIPYSKIKEYPELIETKKIILKTKRLCKTSQN